MDYVKPCESIFRCRLLLVEKRNYNKNEVWARSIVGFSAIANSYDNIRTGPNKRWTRLLDHSISEICPNQKVT